MSGNSSSINSYVSDCLLLFTHCDISGKSASCCFLALPKHGDCQSLFIQSLTASSTLSVSFENVIFSKTSWNQDSQRVAEKKNLPLPFSEQFPLYMWPIFVLYFSRWCVSLVYLRQPINFTLLMARPSWMWAVLKSNNLYEFSTETQFMEVRVTKVCFTLFVKIKDSDFSICV